MGYISPTQTPFVEEHEQSDILDLVWPCLPLRFSPRSARQDPAPPFFAAKQLWEREALNQESCGVFQRNRMHHFSRV